MIQAIYTETHAAGVIARVFLGIAILPHGLQKAFGWFGGKGFLPTLEAMDGMGIPYAIGVLVIAAETIGALALIFGVFGRIFSACIMLVMIGAVIIKHAAYGFFMNWSGMQEGEGWEYHLLAVGLCMVVIIMGSGAFSFDRWLTRRRWA